MSGSATPAKERGSKGPPPRSLAGRIWDQVGTFVLAIAIALAIRAFVIEPYRIPSGSMLPTLLIGDHLFVNKFVYGVPVPFTEWRLPALRDPERGDVVVFTVARGRFDEIHPVDVRPELPRDRFVKRIVGVPGDVLELREGELWLNGSVVPIEFAGETFEDERGRELWLGSQDLAGYVHAVLDDPSVRGVSTARLVVPEGRYFMMGDNRDWSNDSRRWGTVRLTDLKGPAFVLYWSWDWNGPWTALLNPLQWWELLTERMRWERIGSRIR